MKKWLPFAALLLALPAPARAYSFLWADDSTFDARLAAVTSSGQFVQHEVHDVSHSYLVTDFLRPPGGGSAFVSRFGYGLGSSGGGRFETDSSWLRSFWVLGGTGSTTVTMRWRVTTEGSAPSALNSWLLGVDGVQSTSGIQAGAHRYSFAHDWTGTLEYGRRYTLRAETHAYSTAGRSLLVATWDDAPGYPTPEPATWALLGLGLLGLALARRSVFGLYAGCTQAVFLNSPIRARNPLARNGGTFGVPNRRPQKSLSDLKSRA